MRRRRSSPEEVGFNITPMIDLTFLLLIFFMVTSKLSKEQKKMDIALPLAASAVRPEDLSNRDIINLDPQGVLHVGDRPLSDKQMREHLRARPRPIGQRHRGQAAGGQQVLIAEQVLGAAYRGIGQARCLHSVGQLAGRVNGQVLAQPGHQFGPGQHPLVVALQRRIGLQIG